MAGKQRARKNLNHVLETEGREAAQERLKSNTKITESGCWEWQRSKSPLGYGRVSFGPTRTDRAHRIAYEIFKGSFDQSLNVCHTCDNPPCINPDHLWLGTQKENVRDCVAKGRISRTGARVHANSKVTHCRWGHPYSGENLHTQEKPNGKKTRICRACWKRRHDEKREKK